MLAFAAVRGIGDRLGRRAIRVGILVAACASFVGAAQAQVLQESLWIPNGEVSAIVRDGATIYIGGSFTSLAPPEGGAPVARNHIAALDVATGAPTSWDPGANGSVYALAVGGGVVYAGGGFSEIGGEPRDNLASLDPVTGDATAWEPHPNGITSELVVGEGTLYTAGDFDSVAGQPRAFLAAFDIATGLLEPWAPNPNAIVAALAAGGGAVYAGGIFNQIGGQSRFCLAALDTESGAALAWNPAPNSVVTSLAVDDGRVYVGGYFSSIGGGMRNRLAAIDAASGIASVWNPDVNAPVHAIVIDGGTVWAGGSFSHVGGQPRPLVAAIDAGSGAVTWSPDLWAYGSVGALAVAGGAVHVGGDFSTADFTRSDLVGYALNTAGVPAHRDDGSIALAPAKPNPARARALIRYSLPSARDVTLEVYDLSGRRVAAPLVRSPRPAGTHEVTVDAAHWPAGCYLYCLTAGTQRTARRMVVVK